MSSIHETAYPQFKPNLTDQELDEIYTPSQEELKFIHEQGNSQIEKLSLLVLLKTGQRLGYFIPPSDVFSNITAHIAKCCHLNIENRQLRELEQTGARHRLRDLARSYLKLKTFDEECKATDRVNGTNSKKNLRSPPIKKPGLISTTSLG
ncbi:transposase (plasmid) [Candidatus Protochlamydia naegleriophila]|uniref:Transposase n=1 Tax=Candidatus Protochlamydia naegleriophila TaxID=389348 RepID=A0A0U5JGX7_9BACT|nr:DUF4158 domain-containing protein [Candidatus Protochlamydia naegleriophila]CUI18138.1 transposase [Candidatus Protochlamydia naegleriophila]